MKIVITGGHLSPAFSVIEKLKKEEVLFIGRKHALKDDKALSLEYRLCQNLGIPFEEVKTARLQRKSAGRTVLSLFNLPIGTIQATAILRRFKPNAVLGFGGYVSLPVIFAAKMLKVPIIIHEQTLEAGVANKIVSRLADKICISWPSSENFFPRKKTVITGNPIRLKLLTDRIKEANILSVKNNLPVIYITGGSLGSHVVNVLTEEILPKLLKIASVIHQTGDSKKYLDFDRLSKKSCDNYVVKKFLTVEELAAVYKSADLVISRAGINTLTELIYFKKPAFLIPLQIGQKNEQLKNAMFYKNLGLAEVGVQSDLTSEKFLNNIEQMLLNIYKYKSNKSVSNLIKKDAAEKIVEVARNVTRKRSS